MDYEVFIPIVGSICLFGMITAVVVLPAYFKSRERQSLQNVIRAAIEKGQPLPPEVIEAMTKDIQVKAVPSRARDLRKAIVWLAIAAAVITIGVIHGYDEGFDETYGWYAVATVPGFIGLAFLALSLLGKDRKAA